jgi:putative phage-type endonuclease
MIIQDFVQGSKKWLDWRRSKIGASDSPIIMDMNPWKSRYALWEEKVCLRQEPTTNEHMKRGIELEPKAREMFVALTGVKVEPLCAIHEKHSWMAASFDGVSEDGKFILEIKCPRNGVHNQIPDYYYHQVQHQIAIANVDFSYYFSFDGVDGKLLEIPRNDACIREMIEKEAEFFQMIQDLKAPEFSKKDFQVREDNDWMIATDIWKDLNRRKKQLEEQEEKARKRLLELSNGLNCTGNGVQLTKVVRKGSIPYSEIPEVQVLDLEKHRKPVVESWRLAEKK